MNQIKRKRLYYGLAAILLSCFSGTFLLMPLAGRFSRENGRAVLACVGALFWITGIGGYTLLFLARRAERRMGRKEEGAKRIGIFPVNTVARILDIVFAVGVVILIAWSGRLSMQLYGAYVVLFVTTMAFHMRLLLGTWTDRGRKCPKEGMKNDRGGKKGTKR